MVFATDEGRTVFLISLLLLVLRSIDDFFVTSNFVECVAFKGLFGGRVCSVGSSACKIMSSLERNSLTFFLL